MVDESSKLSALRSNEIALVLQKFLSRHGRVNLLLSNHSPFKLKYTRGTLGVPSCLLRATLIDTRRGMYTLFKHTLVHKSLHFFKLVKEINKSSGASNRSEPGDKFVTNKPLLLVPSFRDQN